MATLSDLNFQFVKVEGPGMSSVSGCGLHAPERTSMD